MDTANLPFAWSSVAIKRCCIQGWYLGSLVVRRRRDGAGTPLRSGMSASSSMHSAHEHPNIVPSQLAAKLKLNAPHAHTWLEIVAARWGTVAHLVFMFFGLATNIIVSSMLILGGSATVTALTGMHTIAVSYHLPYRQDGT